MYNLALSNSHMCNKSTPKRPVIQNKMWEYRMFWCAHLQSHATHDRPDGGIIIFMIMLVKSFLKLAEDVSEKYLYLSSIKMPSIRTLWK